MKKKFNFSRITILSAVIIVLCVFVLSSCGSKYGQKTAYLEASAASQTGGCGGTSNIAIKSDWLIEQIENGVDSAVNDYLKYIENEDYYDEAKANQEAIKLNGKLNGVDCEYEKDGQKVKVRNYISNLELLLDTFVNEKHKQAIANSDDPVKVAEHYQVALIESDIVEFKNYVANIDSANKESIEKVKAALNGTANCIDVSSEKEAILALKEVENTKDVYLIGALFLIKVEDRLAEAEPVTFKARNAGEFFENFWNNIFIFPVAWLLYAISNLFGGYYIIGLLITTLLVRTIGWPIYAKSNDMSAKMNELQPELQKIQEKYAGRNDADSQRMMQMEQAQLYKKHKIGIGGCLAPFIQFPIFMAVYNAISRLPYTKAIAGSSVYTYNWANELDGSLFGVNLFEDRNGGGTNQLIGVIVLVLLVVGTQVLSQLLSQYKQKKAQEKRQEDIPAYRRQAYNQTQNQTASTMKFMLWFMIFMMGSFVWTSKAGLGVYWFIGNLYSIAQMFVNNYISQRKKDKSTPKKSVFTIHPEKK